MKTKLLTLIIVVVLVGLALYLTGPDRLVDLSKNGGNGTADGETTTLLAGEVTMSLADTGKTLKAEMNPPDFFIKQDNGNVMTLGELTGKRMFINFWYTGCTYCRAEMQDLQKLYSQYGDSVEFIFVNAFPAEKSEKAVTKYLSDNELTIPVYLDRAGDVTQMYGVRGFPSTLVLDNNGEVLYAAAGQISYDKAKALILD